MTTQPIPQHRPEGVLAERAARRAVVRYPESDGKPLGETDFHVRETLEYALLALDVHFADRPDVYVASNNFIYWVEGDPKKQVSPDCYVVFGVPKQLRRIFKVWEEGRAPAFVLEVTSRRTGLNDVGRKMELYARELRVADYFLFDPLADWIPEQLRGYRLDGGVYVPVAADPRGRLRSEALGLDVAVVDGHVRFFAPGSETPLPTPADDRRRAADEARRADEQARRADEQARRADEQARRADAAEAELASLRAELERLRARS